METKDEDDFQLSSELHGHSKDVRCLAEAVFPEDRIVSGSRDGTVRVWDREGNLYQESHQLKGHKGFVSAIETAPGDDEYPLGRIYSGGQDKTIRMYSSDPPMELWVMEGHQDTVCALMFDPNSGQLVSGSWDKTARVWLGRDCLAKLEGHEAAVWSVAVVPSEVQSRVVSVLTGSADKTIKLWVDGKHLRTFTGHTDCVRGVVVLSASQFLTCANDAVIRLWDLPGATTLQTYSGHENYIYSMSWLSPGHRFVTGGEDRSVRVWSLPPGKANCVQTLLTPAQSVWTVLGLSNGDIACGSSDGVIRVFSMAAERQAAPDVAEVYRGLVNAFTDTTKKDEDLGGIKISDLPGPEALFAPGNKEGQSKMVREDGKVVLYEWTGSVWKKVGDVMSAKGPSEGKTMYMGKEYDSVIDVDIEDGKPPLKLPYNLSEDPWYAAQRFIDTNNLPLAYLDTIAQYIVANVPGAGKVGGVDPSAAQAQTYADPLTGGARYVPQPTMGGGGTGGTWNAGGDVIDPYTGSGRYVPGSTGPPVMPMMNGGGSSDPLTGAGRYVPGSAGYVPTAPGVVTDPTRPRSETLPLKDFEYYCSINSKTIEKLKEFNTEKIPAASGNQLSSDQIQCLESFASLPNIANSDASLHNSVIKCFEKGLETWPIDSLIPLLDVFQYSIHQSAVINEHFLRAERGKQLVDQFIGILSKFGVGPSVKIGETSPVPPIGVLVAVCRSFGNAFAHEHGRLTLSFCGHHLIPVLVQTALRAERPLAHSAGLVVIENLCFREFSLGTNEGRLTLLKTLVESLLPVIDALDGGQRWSEDISAGLTRCVGSLMWGSKDVIQAGKVIPKTGWLVTRLKDRLTVEQAKHDARCVERMLGML